MRASPGPLRPSAAAAQAAAQQPTRGAAAATPISREPPYRPLVTGIPRHGEPRTRGVEPSGDRKRVRTVRERRLCRVLRARDGRPRATLIFCVTVTCIELGKVLKTVSGKTFSANEVAGAPVVVRRTDTGYEQRLAGARRVISY